MTIQTEVFHSGRDSEFVLTEVNRQDKHVTRIELDDFFRDFGALVRTEFKLEGVDQLVHFGIVVAWKVLA